MRRFIEKNTDSFDVVVFVVEPIDEVRFHVIREKHDLLVFDQSIST